MTAAPGHLFVFGLGFSAQELAHRLIAQGWRVSGTTRDPEKADRLAADGIDVLVDSAANEAAIRARVAAASHLLSSVPPAESGDPIVRRWGRDLAEGAKRQAWVGYLSTTGVYGDRDGAWVDESSPLAPTTERGRRRLAAERAWWELYRDHGLPVEIFRLAGIYGPGRSALDSVRAGKARRIVKPGQVFSRIHVSDIAATLAAAIARPWPGTVVNVCDDEPAPPQDVIAYACELLGFEPPPEIAFEQAELSPMAASFYRDNKRVDNGRLKNLLGVRLAYPDYRQGLAALKARLDDPTAAG